MKKALLTLALVGATAAAFAQGTINYNTRVTGVVVGHVYLPEPGNGSTVKTGNTASETPTGAQTYGGAFLTGSGWSAQLFSAVGSAQTEGSLVAQTLSVTTFRTGTLGGTIAPIALTVDNVPQGGVGTFQLRVWNNLGGTVNTWAAAQPLWLNGTIAAGKSALFDVSGLGGGVVLPADMVNFRSFNVSFVPEPSSFALAGMGLASLLIFRRRK